MEINSSSDEVLYYASPRNESKWLATNRNQDFEGKEILADQQMNLRTSQPVALRVKIDEDREEGTVDHHQHALPDVELLTMDGNNQDPMDLIFQDNSAIALAWKDENGVTLWEESIQIPSATSPKMAKNGLVDRQNSKGRSRTGWAPVKLCRGASAPLEYGRDEGESTQGDLVRRCECWT